MAIKKISSQTLTPDDLVGNPPAQKVEEEVAKDAPQEESAKPETEAAPAASEESAALKCSRASIT